MALKTALLVVDTQRDFCAGGALAVEGGDAVVAPANRLIEAAGRLGWPIVFSRDWHPANHCSFRAQGGPWPPHCIAGSPGAELHPGLLQPPDAYLISKAMNPSLEAYSAFDGTDLDVLLRQHGVDHVVIAGLTTDYCVRTTALDALRLGLTVTVAFDAIAAVNATPGDGARAIDAMTTAGVIFRPVASILDEPVSQAA